ncbi:hypothetical protein BWQ96_02225 [Gracilariopsis chorda]|uniref:Uncharacterized protein n=1 Tax=Gracilariopsis chorda TaxID=448386 RepID=A0A2V3J0X0_9FLOR|nr:hypothetical protein BWQ96_02225 [Gracilariopsis chorda]|eukprot:PXF48034.1 hypothetical protein BWQ96_02225 [Gracilariopsis chorda]
MAASAVFVAAPPLQAPRRPQRLRPRSPPACRQQPPRPTPPLRSIRAILRSMRHYERLTRPASRPNLDSSRFDLLPHHVKTPSQMLGTLSPGCEGTKGVFPRCNFACKPCYHSEHANRVRVDGMHTVTQVARQMHLLKTLRGESAHCQLIGGEVSLLSPNDHALALQTMRFFGRIPMSFTHGDFDFDYLKRLALLPDGTPRFDRLDFAVHFDMGMRGRRHAKHVRHELQLMPFRRRFVNMFRKLRKHHRVRYYLAHNMTVQPSNLPYLADTVRQLKTLGFRLLSFQPAAQQGAQQRWVSNLRDVADDHGHIVWQQIEHGMGIRLPYSLFQMGDVRCNRMCACGIVGANRAKPHQQRVFPLFDDLCQPDHRIRDLIMTEIGNIALRPRLLYIKALRTILRKPWLLWPLVCWIARVVRRAGGIWPILRFGITSLTIVMHRFMDANDVSVAWQLMQDGVQLDDSRVDRAGPRIRETMERLSACSYAMAQPEHGRVVPACVQHSVYDPVENIQLATQLPLNEPPTPASEAQLDLLNERDQL